MITLIVQGLEYSVSSFTISDGVFGTCFFFGTGFHGLIINVALFIFLYIILKSIIAYFKSFSTNLTINNNKLLINADRPSNKLNANKAQFYYLKKEFIE